LVFAIERKTARLIAKILIATRAIKLSSETQTTLRDRGIKDVCIAHINKLNGGDHSHPTAERDKGVRRKMRREKRKRQLLSLRTI